MSWIIGESVYRKDAIAKITGSAIYTDDFHDKQTLHIKLKTSEYAHAEIKEIDLSEAKKVPGIAAIILGKDLPLTGLQLKDRPILAVDKVRYYGEPIVAVVANEPYLAKEAVEKIKIKYEPLEVINTVLEAFKTDAPLIHPELMDYEKISEVVPRKKTNIASHMKIRKGNINQPWEKSDIMVTANFSIGPSDHAAIETRCAIVEIKPDGKVLVISSTQSPYGVKQELSDVFQIDEGKIQVQTPFVGGGFGGKVATQLEFIAYLASKAANGKRVKIQLTREEDMITAPVRMGIQAKIKLGATSSGKLTAAELTYYIDSGAYADKGTLLTKAVAATCTGPYQIEHVICDAYCMYTNHPYITAYRGFSHSEVLFAFERTMDMLADKLQMDPLLLREMNLIKPGQFTPTQNLLTDSTIGNLPQCVKRLKHLMDWDEGMIQKIDERKIRVKGICCSWKTSTISGASSGVVLLFNRDGSVQILSGIVEIGMGTKTILAQLLAEKLKMNIKDIYVEMEVDTNTVPEHYKTVASRGTLLAGRALLKAADDLIIQLKEMAARILVCSADDLEVAYGKVYVRDEPGLYILIKDICYGYKYPNGNFIGGQMIGRGNYTIRHLTPLNKDTGAGKTGPEWTVGAQGVEIEFDLRDYTYQIINVYSIIDVGKVLNYKMALGQVMGSMSMGLNYASAETIHFDENAIPAIPKLRTYGSFRYGDHPNYIAEFLETAHLDGPFGARGIGEHALIGMPAALANALSRAANVNLNHLPLTPETIWQTKVGVNKQ